MTTPNRPEHADTVRPVKGASRFSVRRHLVGYAYPANGNVHNPTPRYRWHLLLDGRLVDQDSKRSPLVVSARALGAVDAYSPASSVPKGT